MSLRTLSALAGLSVAALASTSARADTIQSSQPYPMCGKTTISPAESELAHQKYIAGKLDYDEAKYDEAIRRFRDAYALDCLKHELLVIISAAYERKGDKKEAVAALETYISRAQSAPDLPTYKEKIETLKKLIAAAPAAPPPTPPPPPPTTPVVIQEHTIYPWIAVGVGALSTIVGTIVFATAPAFPRECEGSGTTCENTTKPVADQATKSANQTSWGLGLMIGGGVAIAGGLVWHFLEPTGPKESSGARTSVRPVIGPGIAGMALGGSF